MPFDDLNESTIVEFTEESSGDENIGNAGDFTYTPENLEVDDEEESDNVLCGQAAHKVTHHIQFCVRKSYTMLFLKEKNVCFLV